MWQDMKRDALQLVKSIYRANNAVGKKEYLENFLDEFEILKLELRICADLKVLSFNKQAELSVLMDSIGGTCKTPSFRHVFSRNDEFWTFARGS